MRPASVDPSPPPDPSKLPPPDSPEALQRPASLREMFVAFTLLALQGFGGVLAIAQRVLVEERRWLTKSQFVELLALSQVLPGPNICNMALMIGDRFFGWRGAHVALAGMMLVPLVIVLALTALYAQFASVPAVSGALRGMGAVAAGMIVGTALKLVGTLRGNPLGMPASAALAATALLMVAGLRWPLVWVLLGLGAAATTLAYVRMLRQERA